MESIGFISSEKKTRKFIGPDFYINKKPDYYLLPFRFHRITKTKELIVNDLGDYLLLPFGTVSRIVSKQIDKNEESDLYYDLISSFFISESEIPALMPLMEARYATKKSFIDNFTSLHIFVISLRCEHTCHYCQVSRVTENKEAFDMPTFHIDHGIALMMQSPNPHVTMEFQGGEALLAFDKIQYAVLKAKSEAEKRGKAITFVICTNMAPLSDEMLPFLKEHRILMSTSLDGPDFIHNKNRHRPQKNSYELAIAGIEKCRQYLGVEMVSALLTTTALSLDYPVEIVDEYVACNFKSIFLRPISPYGFAIHNAKKNKYEMEKFLEFYKIAFQKILDYNRNGYFMREDYATVILKKIMTPFAVGYVDLQSPAGLINNVIVFNYDGKVYASDEARMLAETKDYTFQLGELGINSYNDIFYGDKAIEISDYWTNESLAGCSECAFQTYCGADPVMNHATQGTLYGFRPTSVFCQKNMGIITYLFELMDSNPSVEDIFRSWIKS